MGYMAKANGGGKDWEPVGTGTHFARCVTVCDLGLQPTGYGTKEKIYLGFEVPGVRVTWTKDGQEHEGPALLGSTYTLSVHEKSILGQHLVSWRGKDFTEEERNGFDLFTVLGAPCMVSVVHNTKGEKTYANIAAIMRVPQGTAVPEAETEKVGYSACHPDFSKTIDKLPEWLRNKALEGQRMGAEESAQFANPAPPVAIAETIAQSPKSKHWAASEGPYPGPFSMPPDNDFDDDIPF